METINRDKDNPYVKKIENKPAVKTDTTIEAATAESAFKKTSTSPKSVYYSSDFLIPRLMLVQDRSQFLKQYNCKIGDIIDANTGEVLATEKVPMNVIPIMTWKTVTTFEKVGTRWKPIKGGAVRAWDRLKDRDYAWEEEGFLHRVAFNFYVMVESKMSDPAATPYALSFRGSSYSNGKKMVQRVSAADRLGLDAWASTMQIFTHQKSNASGEMFHVIDVGQATQTNVKYAQTLAQWGEIIGKSQAHTAEDDAEREVEEF